MPKMDGIDIMKLYTLGHTKSWNQELDKYMSKLDINGLAVLRYRLQVGISNLEKQKLLTEEISVWFVRLDKSILDTARKIIRVKQPLPPDNPLNKNNTNEMIEAKRKRDQALSHFLSRSSY